MLLRAHQSGCTQPRLLILSDDAELLRLMIEGLNRPCMKPERVATDDPCGVSCECGLDGRPCVQVIDSLHRLYEGDLERWDVLLCGSMLDDGSGFDALAFARGMRPDMPVIMTAPPGESALAVEAIRAGAADVLLATAGNMLSLPLAIEKSLAQHRTKRENERLQADLARSVAETAVKNRQLEALIEQLETMARTDELTGLCNRRWFNLMLERAWAEAIRSGTPLAFAMMDLDGFKTINDHRGHQRGDELLRLAGRVIQANSRTVDLPARYGGDEFCILMPHTHVWEAAKVMQRITDAFAVAMQKIGEEGQSLSMSVGVSHIDVTRPSNADQLVLHADEALYAAKDAGKRCIMIREPRQAVPFEESVQSGAPVLLAPKP